MFAKGERVVIKPQVSLKELQEVAGGAERYWNCFRDAPLVVIDVRYNYVVDILVDVNAISKMEKERLISKHQDPGCNHIIDGATSFKIAAKCLEPITDYDLDLGDCRASDMGLDSLL